MQTHSPKPKLPNTLLTRDTVEKVVLYTAITGIVVLAIALFGAAFIKIPTSIQTAAVEISSVFYPADTRLQLSLESRYVENGVPLTLSWSAPATDIPGSFLFAYKCAQGLTVFMENRDGEYEPINCEQPTEPLVSGNQVRIRLTSTENRFLDVPLAVAFYPEGDPSPLFFSRALVTVENPRIAFSPSLRPDGTVATSTTPDTPTPPETTTPTPPAKKPTEQTTPRQGASTSESFQIPRIDGSAQTAPRTLTGKSDLSVKIMNVGYIDDATKGFVITNTVEKNNVSAVMFAVENTGTNSSGSWDFAAILPTNPPYIFQSPTQRELLPGERIEFTMGFDRVKEGASSVEIKINIDPSQKISESNETNNSTIATIGIRN